MNERFPLRKVTPDSAAPPSPCNKICVLDSAGTLCTGCYRTLDEIARWSELSAAEKYSVLELLTARRAT